MKHANQKKNNISTSLSSNNDNNNDSNNDNNNDNNVISTISSICKCMGFSLAGLTLIGLLGGYVTWIILSIIALANNSNDDIRDKCDNSNIWVCLLILVVIGILSIISGSKSSEDKKTTILPIVLFNIAFIIWVGIELYKPCALNHLSDMNIYIILYAWFADMYNWNTNYCTVLFMYCSMKWIISY